MTLSGPVPGKRAPLPDMRLLLFVFDLLGPHFCALDNRQGLSLPILKALAEFRSRTSILF
jgi:hypothetical protein